jgi:hypothetical protein
MAAFQASDTIFGRIGDCGSVSGFGLVLFDGTFRERDQPLVVRSCRCVKAFDSVPAVSIRLGVLKLQGPLFIDGRHRNPRMDAAKDFCLRFGIDPIGKRSKAGMESRPERDSIRHGGGNGDRTKACDVLLPDLAANAPRFD